MGCSSLSIANGLKLNSIRSLFRRYKIPFQSYGDAIHQTYANKKHVYYFLNGTVVTWNLYRHEINAVLHQIRKFRINAYRCVEEDHFSYQINGKTDIKPHQYFNVDMITLEEDDNELYLSIAYALSQSIKLKSYEEYIEILVKEHTYFAKDLANKGDIRLSRNRILKIMGKIFLAKQEINLASEYHNPPKFFWNRSNLETDFLLIEKFMDVPQRVAVLNQKLDTLNEMFDMLNSQLQHRHSSALEVIIILLLIVEISFSLLHFWF